MIGNLLKYLPLEYYYVKKELHDPFAVPSIIYYSTIYSDAAVLPSEMP